MNFYSLRTIQFYNSLYTRKMILPDRDYPQNRFFIDDFTTYSTILQFYNFTILKLYTRRMILPDWNDLQHRILVETDLRGWNSSLLG